MLKTSVIMASSIERSLYESSFDTTSLYFCFKSSLSKTSLDFNQAYFKTRDHKKNALAISSNQSSKIDSFSLVEKKFKDVLENENLERCPIYWGGFSFTPFIFEFWKGNKFRLNKRDLYSKENNKWVHTTLEP